MQESQSRGEQGKAVTRRQAILGAALTMGGAVLCSNRALAVMEEEISHSAEAIHQETSV